jgi:hypothetical protein
MKSPSFIIRCIVYESELNRPLSDEEKLEIASKLFETGEWKSSFGELMKRASIDDVSKQIEKEIS